MPVSVLLVGVRQESADGFELRFAVNYPAGFLLSGLLLPLLRASAPARIVLGKGRDDAPALLAGMGQDNCA